MADEYKFDTIYFNYSLGNLNITVNDSRLTIYSINDNVSRMDNVILKILSNGVLEIQGELRQIVKVRSLEDIKKSYADISWYYGSIVKEIENPELYVKQTSLGMFSKKTLDFFPAGKYLAKRRKNITLKSSHWNLHIEDKDSGM